jgi:hypothetical protein
VKRVFYYLSSLTITERIRLFLEKYGDKGLLVLRVAFELAQDPYIDHRFGDFSFKHLVLKLQTQGFKYNPVNLLRVLEKEFGVIEKSYTSSNQTWWRFIDFEAVRSVLSEYYGVSYEDPRLKYLLIKYKSLEPTSILDTLKRLTSKDVLSAGDREVFRDLVFNVLDKIVEILSEMEKYEDVFAAEITVLREILNLAELVSNKLTSRRSNMMRVEDITDAHLRTSLLKDTPSYKRNTSS